MKKELELDKPKAKKVMKSQHFKILKEKEEKWVRMDVEMSDDYADMLFDYANENMPISEEYDFYISWALKNILTKEIKK